MLQIERALDATAINAVLNHPAVRPWVADMAEGEIDLTPQVANRNNVLLMGEHGGGMFFQLMPGCYELHTAVLPEGRGPWVRDFGHAAARWMFTRTPAFEILTRVPDGHLAAKGATLASGARYEFTRPRECRFRGQLVDLHVYALRLQDWLCRAPGLVEHGAAFHAWLNAQARRQGVAEPPHEDDENHNRHVGAALLMAEAGQPAKGVSVYNRWAQVSRHPTVRLLALDPPAIRFDIGVLRLAAGAMTLEIAA